MRPVDKEHDVLRLYLLGRLTEKEQELVEERFMTDLDYQENVLMVEEELIEDYLGDVLSPQDRESFVARLLATPQQRERLEVVKALDRYCSNPTTASIPSLAGDFDNAGHGQSESIAIPLFKKPMVVYALAAVLVVGVLAGAWLFLSQWRQQDFGRQFAQLNGPQGKAQTPDITLVLPPLALRGAESTTISSQGRREIIELLLTLPPGQHRSYQVTFRNGNTSEQYSVSNLEATDSNAGRVVPVRVPSASLTPGDYFLELGGTTPAGTFESIADYSFRISK
jgi:hypothetical protein